MKRILIKANIHGRSCYIWVNYPATMTLLERDEALNKLYINGWHQIEADKSITLQYAE